MCQGSRHAKKFENTEDGATLGIGKMRVDKSTIGAFHRLGQTTAQCVMCVKSGTKLTLGQIPLKLQTKFGIGATAIAEFKEGPWHQDDRLIFENGKDIPLAAFSGQEVSVFVGVKEAAKPVRRFEVGVDLAAKVHPGVLATQNDGIRAAA